jgi:predicted HicB family RNase H-like nuclease
MSVMPDLIIPECGMMSGPDTEKTEPQVSLPNYRRSHNMISPRKTYQTRRAQPLVIVSLRLPPQLRDDLADLADARGTSMTALIVELLTKAVKEESK